MVLDAVVRDRKLYLQARPREMGALATFAVADQFEPGRYRVIVDRAGETYSLEDTEGAKLESGRVGGPATRR